MCLILFENLMDSFEDFLVDQARQFQNTPNFRIDSFRFFWTYIHPWRGVRIRALGCESDRQAGLATWRHKQYQVNEGSPSIMPWVMEVMTGKDQKDPDDRGSNGAAAPSTQDDNTQDEKSGAFSISSPRTFPFFLVAICCCLPKAAKTLVS